MANEMDSCARLVQSMRVPQLQAVLQSFDPLRSNARKQMLVERINHLLRDKKTQATTCQRIREVTHTQPVFPQQPAAIPFNQYAQQHMRSRTTYNHPLFPPDYSSFQHQNSMGNPTVLPARTGGRAESMKISKLPFYDVVDVVLKMSELPSASGRSGDTRCFFTFNIKPEHLPLITYPAKNDFTAPRYELQLRMFLFDAQIEQPDDFPPNCSVKIDEISVSLPQIVPTNKPNAEQKRYSRPVDITPYVQKQKAPLHKLEINWFGDKRTWAVGIWLVHRQNSQVLLNRMLSNGLRRTSEEAKKKIKAMLDGDDDNIAMDQLKLSLLCPLMKTRINLPTRAKTCSHLQCFDLSNFLNMNEKRPSWKCPQCNTNAHYDNLIIDQYFMDMLGALEKNVEEVEILSDGNWKVLEVACDSLSDEDADIIPDNKGAEVSTKTVPASKKEDIDVITLDDSDAELPEPAIPSPRTPQRLPANGKRRISTSSSSSSEDSSQDTTTRSKRKVAKTTPLPPPPAKRRAASVEIITLDSDDDITEKTPQPTPLRDPRPLNEKTNGTNTKKNGNSANGNHSNQRNRITPAIEDEVAEKFIQFLQSTMNKDMVSY